MWEIKLYTSEFKEEWDAFVDNSRNATFLFKRDYMEYHSDRFEDFSLIAYRKGKMSALLPANRTGSILHSHQGLTYGGWLLPPTGLDTMEIFLLWKKWLEFCLKYGIERIFYKPLPYIYATMPSQEDRYLLFLTGAIPEISNISSTIYLPNNPGYNKLQRRHLKSSPPLRIECISGAGGRDKLDAFHAMLTDCLKVRHEALPVHTSDELLLLMKKFPSDIRLWLAYTADERLVCGVWVFETALTVHCQYIATSEEGRKLNTLPLLFKKMIDHYTAEGLMYFDFGTSNEEDGYKLNSGLNRQKTSLGGSGVTYTRFEISVFDALASLPTSLWPEG